MRRACATAISAEGGPFGDRALPNALTCAENPHNKIDEAKREKAAGEKILG